MGRFINADALVSTGQGLLGNNMFAYCGNNPVMRIDPTGMYHYVYGVDSSPNTLDVWHHYAGGGGTAVSDTVSSSSGSNQKPNLPSLNPGNPLNPFNTDETVVLRAKYFAFYKGIPVFKADLGNGGAFSFIIIVIDDNYTTNQKGINTVKHEYGHWVHLSQIGPILYFITTAIPSLVGAGLNNAGRLPTDLYYNLPWERLADFYGGVHRPEHTDWSLVGAFIFWVHTVSVC